MASNLPNGMTVTGGAGKITFSGTAGAGDKFRVEITKQGEQAPAFTSEEITIENAGPASMQLPTGDRVLGAGTYDADVDQVAVATSSATFTGIVVT